MPMEGFAVAFLATSIDFSEKTWPPPLIRTSGLSQPETWGSWSDGKVVAIEFPALPKRLSLHLRARAYGSNVGQDFVARIGEGTVRFSLGESFEMKTFEMINPTRSNVLTIDVPSPISPQELGLSSDARSLGIGLIEVRIAPLE
jgi:phosphoglycerol transferase